MNKNSVFPENGHIISQNFCKIMLYTTIKTVFQNDEKPPKKIDKFSKIAMDFLMIRKDALYFLPIEKFQLKRQLLGYVLSNLEYFRKHKVFK